MFTILSNPQFWFALTILVGLTNILTQVLKQITWNKVPTNWLVTIIAVILSEVAIFVYCQLNMIVYLASYPIIGVIVGFLVAFGAMFGFDKLKEALEALAKLKANK